MLVVLGIDDVYQGYVTNQFVKGGIGGAESAQSTLFFPKITNKVEVSS